MDSTEGNSKLSIPIITAVLSVASAVFVAFISHSTSVQVAEIQEASRQVQADQQRAAQEASEKVERDKLQDEQETRREQFLAANIPKLLSSNDAERRAGMALLFEIYPNQAPEILGRIASAAAAPVQANLASATSEAERVSKETGSWAIVIGADNSIDLPKRWIENAKKLGYTPAAIYLRAGTYNTAVGSYSSRQAADVAAIAIRPKTRPDAYPVALGAWCKSPAHSGQQPELWTCQN